MKELVNRVQLLLRPRHTHCLKVHSVEFVFALFTDHSPHMRFQNFVFESIRFESVESVPQCFAMEDSLCSETAHRSNHTDSSVSDHVLRFLSHENDELRESLFHQTRTLLNTDHHRVDGHSANRSQSGKEADEILFVAQS